MANSHRILLKVQGDGASAMRAMNGIAGGNAETILQVPPSATSPGVAPGMGQAWLRVNLPAQSSNPWDEVHALMAQGHALASTLGSPIMAAEPDIDQQWPYTQGDPLQDSAASEADRCRFQDQDGSDGRAVGPAVAWNARPDFSGFADARARVGQKMAQVKIAHLDTGFDPAHETKPLKILSQRNFVESEHPNDATDRTPDGMSFIRNRGHGTATLCLLAGNQLDGASIGWLGFKDYVGGAPLVGVIPIRIANWVVRLSTGTMVQGFQHAISQGVDVLTMSMGGLSSHALVDAVNLAYDSGIFMVTAAGNSFAGLPTPSSIVFPARYRRVLAACGVMADGRAYTGLKFGTMQGNFGPQSKMDTALGAYTPNVPWAKIDCQNIVDMDGAGTSAATPQIAAAAALWLAEHWTAVQAYSHPWMRVEATRKALFDSAQKSTAKMSKEETHRTLGQGVLCSAQCLAIQPALAAALTQQPQAQPSWSWLNLIFGGGVSLSPVLRDPRSLAMFRLELTQMAQSVHEVSQAIPDPDLPADQIPASQRLRYLEAALAVGNPSLALRGYLEEILQRRSTALALPSSPLDTRPLRRSAIRPPEPQRRLRVFALDPSLGKSLNSLAINETVLQVPWEDLDPGPVGEYLEVVDVDPASNRFYAPVNLDNPVLLAQDGWPPSEGNSQFHQQMVYAVGMTTIRHFERALGRKAQWPARAIKDASGEYITPPPYVQRLRVYPHAFRGSNAYYSPNKRALLFGYFPANSRDGDATAPGSMVFACLSSDIVAHEMTHALLDGLHRRFEEASNPDVPAFHEGFADIVAVFQHFTITELVRFEIGRSHADLTAKGLLAGLAQQFGEGSSRGGPLRNYNDPRMETLKYTEALEPHTRGSILVYAVYEAFLNLVAFRTNDLLRIATGGTGILPSGALHPDLVQRLTVEVCQTAADVLQMCIRALDYCPPVDITFGEYLRAIITADIDFSSADGDGRRVAFMEAFRRRGILPRDVRTVSDETLSWTSLDLDSMGPGPSGDSWSDYLFQILDDKDLTLEGDLETNRKLAYEQNERNRKKVWQALDRFFSRGPSFYALFGLVPDLPHFNDDWTVKSRPSSGRSTFEVHSARPARRVKTNGSFQTDIIIVVNQRRPELIDPTNPNGGYFWFRGGATLILDPRARKVRYNIVKSMSSSVRLERQRKTAARPWVSPLRATYFGQNATLEPFAIMHAQLSEGEDAS